MIQKREQLKVRAGVFDNITLNALYKLYGKHFDSLKGPISTGKEAIVYLAENGKKNVALKIYRIIARQYKTIKNYIEGDPRFSKVKMTPKSIMFAWAQKEYKNLEVASSVMNVPKPIAVEKNILVMDFIGINGIASPLARNALPKNPEKWKKVIFKWVKDLWVKKRLVHGDLSEWNIMNHKEEPVIIDISQAVLREHPLSLKLLRRDVETITKWFNKLGVFDESLLKWLNKVESSHV